MSDNPQMDLARKFLEQTGINVFLTGKAGTGKTTFLRDLRQSSPKRMIVVAPQRSMPEELPFTLSSSFRSDLTCLACSGPEERSE